MRHPGRRAILMGQSEWREWKDADGTWHVEIVLTPQDQMSVGPFFLDMLREAGSLIQAAFAEVA